MTQNYLTRCELAKRWKISLTTIRRMEKRGDLNPIRLSGRLVRFDLAGIERVERDARCNLAM